MLMLLADAILEEVELKVMKSTVFIMFTFFTEQTRI